MSRSSFAIVKSLFVYCRQLLEKENVHSATDLMNTTELITSTEEPINPEQCEWEENAHMGEYHHHIMLMWIRLSNKTVKLFTRLSILVLIRIFFMRKKFADVFIITVIFTLISFLSFAFSLWYFCVFNNCYKHLREQERWGNSFYICYQTTISSTRAYSQYQAWELLFRQREVISMKPTFHSYHIIAHLCTWTIKKKIDEKQYDNLWNMCFESGNSNIVK